MATTSPSDYKPNIISNPDGTYKRLIAFPSVPANPDPTTTSSPVLSKDIPINPITQTWLRLYLPRQAIDSSSEHKNKLPLVVYYHGGGFVFVSAASTITHDFCFKMAAQLPAIVASVEYRLAPEHRLPAAYEDAVEALHCIKTSQESWLLEYADFSSCFLMGSSAGANIAYHAGLRASQQVNDLQPLKIKGLILHHSFFSGSEWTQSELEILDDPFVSAPGIEYLWGLALPVDVAADRDHEYSNPIINGGSNMGRFGDLGWRVMVAGCYGDPLIDRQRELVKVLEGNRVLTTKHFYEGYHGVETAEPSKADQLFSVLKDFIF